MSQELEQIKASILELASNVRDLKRGGNNSALDALALRVTALEGAVSGNVAAVASVDAPSVDANGNPVVAVEPTRFFDTFLAALNEEVPVVNVEPAVAVVEPVADAPAAVTETPVADVSVVYAEAIPANTDAAVAEPAVAAVEAPVAVEPVAVVEAPVETPVTQVAETPVAVEPVVENAQATATTY